jgi:hypothetical protein
MEAAMRRGSKLILIIARAAIATALPACANSAGESDAGAQLAAAPIETRRQLDSETAAWFTTRKGLPDTPGVADCVAEQLHVQALSDDGARALVAALYAVGSGSDPWLGALSAADRERVYRATALCGTTLPLAAARP